MLFRSVGPSSQRLRARPEFRAGRQKGAIKEQNSAVPAIGDRLGTGCGDYQAGRGVHGFNEEKDLAAGKKIGLILTEENKGRIEADEVEYVGSRFSYEDIAHNLFAVLRRFDEKNIDIIYSESFDESELGWATSTSASRPAS